MINNITPTYIATEGKEIGQPINFEITNYNIDVKNKFIKVEYLKHVMNKDNNACLYSEAKSYLVKDIPATYDEEGNVVEAENLEFTNWRLQTLQGLIDLGIDSVENMFFQNTLPKIVRINGLESEVSI